MSKLIREDKKEALPANAKRPDLSSRDIIQHLKACQNLSKEHIDRAFDLFLTSLSDAFDIEIDKARSNEAATKLMGTQRVLRKNAADMKHYFGGYFLEGFVKFSKKKLNTSIGHVQQRGDESSLGIVENEELEETIAISSITQRVDAYFAEPLWALNQRFAVLNKDEPVTESSNPVAPIQFCDALRRVIKVVDLDASSKLIAYKVFDLQVMNLFKLVSEDINAYLQNAGILPGLKYSLPRRAVPKSYLAEDTDQFGRREGDVGITRPGPDAKLSHEQYQADLISAIRDLHHQLEIQAAAVDPNMGSVDVQQIVAAIVRLQHQPHLAHASEGLLPVNAAGLMNELKATLGNDAGMNVQCSEMQTIDLVGMVFEYMLNDDSIPDRVKALLSYLHTPFLKIAFIDPEFFERSEHPARVLLNVLAEAGSKWVGNDGSAQFDMYEQIKGIVNHVLSDFDSDVKVITELLFKFNAYVKKISHKQELTEKRAKERAEGENKLKEVKYKVNKEIRSLIRGRELPSAVLLLLLQPWTDYLTFILLRFDERSEKWNDGLKLIFDLLWCIDPKNAIEERNKQLLLQKDIRRNLRAGFELIRYDHEKGEKLIGAFVSLCEMASASKKPKPAPEPMRSELERIADQKAGYAPVEEEPCSPEEAQMVESLKMIEFGTWFEFSDGRRLKVAWYNGRTSQYMLVDQMGKRVDMQSGLTLARKLINADVKIISGSSKPFFERALENIYQKLNEKAETGQQEAVNDEQ